MFDTENLSDGAAGRMADNVCARNAECIEQADHVGRQAIDGVGDAAMVALADAAMVERHDVKRLREDRNLLTPVIGVTAEPGDEHHRIAATGALIMQTAVAN